MRLPHHLVGSRYFQFSTLDELMSSFSSRVDENERELMKSLDARGLLPVTSPMVLAQILGVNPGIIWHFINKPHNHYRKFEIKKGKGIRVIYAPRVALKIVQVWLSYHFSRLNIIPSHVFGFVPGKSHLDAAMMHRNAQWSFSVDIENFFSTTPKLRVQISLMEIGYAEEQAKLLSELFCVNGFLAQGAPSSPPISNICFMEIDHKLSAVADRYNSTLTRYADDIIFSGIGEFDPLLRVEVENIFQGIDWKLAPAKTLVQPLKGRIKIHGLLVSNGRVRLTKGYRNKIRAYRHILKKGVIDNGNTIIGHVNYASQVERYFRHFNDL